MLKAVLQEHFYFFSGFSCSIYRTLESWRAPAQHPPRRSPDGHTFMDLINDKFEVPRDGKRPLKFTGAVVSDLCGTFGDGGQVRWTLWHRADKRWTARVSAFGPNGAMRHATVVKSIDAVCDWIEIICSEEPHFASGEDEIQPLALLRSLEMYLAQAELRRRLTEVGNEAISVWSDLPLTEIVNERK